MLVLPLNDGHDRKGFDCDDVELNDWLSQTARQHKEKAVSSTFVAVADETSADVLGFYAISLAELVNADLSAQYRKRLPTKVPVFRLGRLATAKRHQGKGIGEHMLFDALRPGDTYCARGWRYRPRGQCETIRGRVLQTLRLWADGRPSAQSVLATLT
jgi:hypothetical protein